MSYERNGGELHGNISRNGYGNAMIGRYGGCFEEDIWWVYGTGEIHGLNISHKELTYLLQKSNSHRNKVLCACS